VAEKCKRKRQNYAKLCFDLLKFLGEVKKIKFIVKKWGEVVNLDVHFLQKKETLCEWNLKPGI
jgi:hypothetical protein